MADYAELPDALAEIEPLATPLPIPANVVIDLYLSWAQPPGDADTIAERLQELLGAQPALTTYRRITVGVCSPAGAAPRLFTFRPSAGRLHEDRVLRDMHPMAAHRLELWRLTNFDNTRLASPADAYLLHLVAKDNPADERLVALAEVRDATPEYDAAGDVVGMPMIERTLEMCLDAIRRERARRESSRGTAANRILLNVWPVIDLPVERAAIIAKSLVPLAVGAGLEDITIKGRLREKPGAPPRDVALSFTYRPGAGVVVRVSDPPTEPLRPLDGYAQAVQRSQARGAVYPYELVAQLVGQGGTFVEHDLDEHGELVAVQRPYGQNTAGLVVAVVTTPTPRYPEGMTRVACSATRRKAMGSVAEPECTRIIAALDLAERMRRPGRVVRAVRPAPGSRWTSGTENMDWIAAALRRIVTFTQAGGEINVVVAGVNVGAQPYWNAEATMLMHTRGILVMTPGQSRWCSPASRRWTTPAACRPRTTSASAATTGSWAPTARRSTGRRTSAGACRVLFAHYEPRLRRARRALTAAGAHRPTRSTATSAR